MSSILGKPKMPAPPKIEPPAPMPNEEDIKKRKSAEIAAIQSRSGRQSTFLSGDNGSIGL